MPDVLSLEDLRLTGRQQAQQAGALLKGLGCHEGLARVSALRRDFQKRKLVLYTRGLSPAEVRAWSEGYHAGLREQLTAWLMAVEL